MTDLDTVAFIELFKRACKDCFGQPLESSLSETESKLLSNKIFEQTGLVIGPKSLKNYSLFVFDPASKGENPSVATLDTLARFVLNAPYTDEIQRKKNEGHYPFWFEFRNSLQKRSHRPSRKIFVSILILLALAVLLFTILFLAPRRKSQNALTEDFRSLSDDSLSAHGWFIHAPDPAYWHRRGERAAALTLFTLKGDNWPDSSERPIIRNLLLRNVSSDCFSVEMHLADFFPTQNWQQAGMILLEDTGFSGRSLRLSLSYNDFFGGFPKSREVIIQAIISKGKNNDKPEEIAHQLVFKLDSSNESLVRENLRHSALRIEKNGSTFRLLFANGSMANAAFKEIIRQDVDINPRMIGLFALKGFVDQADIIPAQIDFFAYKPEKCGR